MKHQCCYKRVKADGVHQWCDDIPEFCPERTLLFFGTYDKPFHDLMTVRFRKVILETFQAAAESGKIDTVVIEYTTPFGYLAVETLDKFQEEYPNIRFYVLMGQHIRYRKSYRRETEPYVEFIFQLAHYGYSISGVGALQAFQRLRIPTDCACWEGGLLRSK